MSSPPDRQPKVVTATASIAAQATVTIGASEVKPPEPATVPARNGRPKGHAPRQGSNAKRKGSKRTAATRGSPDSDDPGGDAEPLAGAGGRCYRLPM